MRAATPQMQALLASPAGRALVACDLYTFALVDGTTMFFTSFDRDVVYNGIVYSSATRLEIGAPGLPRISWKRGINVDRLVITLAPRAADPGDLNLTLAQALVAGRFDGCKVTLERTFNPIVSPSSPQAQVDPSLGTIVLFVGLVSEVAIDRTIARITVAPISELLNIQFPRHHFTTQCRWTLFDAGCSNSRTASDGSISAGSQTLVSSTLAFTNSDVGRPITVVGAGAGGSNLVTTISAVESSSQATLAAPAAVSVSGATVTIGLLAQNFAVSGSAAAGSTRTQVLAALDNPPGYFDLGRIVFTGGANLGISRTVQSYYAGNESYEQAVLADQPVGYWRLGQNANDYSGNGFNGTVSGGVTFGQPGALAGDTMTSALFDGSSGYITFPLPDPGSMPNSESAISFEFWVKPAYPQMQGIFDTDPYGEELSGGYRQGPGAYALRNFNYGYGGFEWNPAAPAVAFAMTPGVWQHVVVVFRGMQYIDVFANGRLAASASAQGNGVYEWTELVVGRCYFNWTGNNYNWGIPGSGTPGSPPAPGFYYVYFSGYLQELAVYNYALSFDQIANHYRIGSIGPNSYPIAQINLWQALPYAPNPGDPFVIYPGCDKTVFSCARKFNNLINFGGFPFIPTEETAL